MSTILAFFVKYKIALSFTTVIGFMIATTGFVVNEIIIYKKQTLVYESTLNSLKKEISSTSNSLNIITRTFIKTEIEKIEQELRLINSPVTDPRVKEYSLRTRKIFLEAELEKLK